MDNSVGTKDGNVSAAEVASTVNPVMVTDSVKSDENTSVALTAVETKAPSIDDKSEIDSEGVEAAKAIADDENLKSNIASVKVDELNVAMATTSISSTHPDDIKQSQGKDVSNEHHKQVIITENENGVVDNANVDSDISVKTPLEIDEEANSTIGVFEDACDYVDVDDDEESDHHNVSDQEHISAAESCGEGEELLDDEEGKEAIPVPSVPVPVDDDTNDPQYIPRRGRFYEHDDRMAYSTTSSEGSNSDNGYEDDSGEDDGESSDRCRIRRRRTSSKRSKSTIATDMPENNTTSVADSTMSSKKVLEISKVAAPIKASSETSASGSAKKPGSRKSRDIDSLDKWTHDMYDEREQTRKSRDELLVSYGYDIREESEAPRARRHHKYGRAATTKYTRSWQDTKAYTGAGGAQHSSKVKRGGLGQRSVGGLNKNKNKSATSDEYTSEFPALENVKPLESSTSTENPVVAEALGQKQDQHLKSPSVHDEKKTVFPSTGTGPSRHHNPPSRSATKYATSPGNRNYQQDHQNGPTSFSSHNKNFFNRSSSDSPIVREKSGQVNRENSSGAANYFNRKQQPQSSSHIPNHNYKQNLNNIQGGQGNNQHHQHSSSAAPRGRNFHQHHNNSPQKYNRDRYFAKGSLSQSSNSNQQHYDHSHHNRGGPTTAGTGRTQHSGNYHHINSRHYENEPIEQPLVPPPPVVRSSKRYSVQSRRELPDPVLNFGGMSKAPQSQQPAPGTQHQQQNGLVMQDQQQTALQQMQASPQQLQQQQPIQIHQQPPPIQIQQYHQPLQQLHHGMVLDHNSGMMVMATDPSLYHQIYATPQYATTPGSATGGTDDQSAAVAAAAALLMLAAQAAVYQPVPTGATGLTSPPSGSQTLQQQQSETFMTTYYQPQQQPQQQPPPRRVNLAIPIVAPPPEPNQHGPSKTNSSSTPPPATAAASTN